MTGACCFLGCGIHLLHSSDNLRREVGACCRWWRSRGKIEAPEEAARNFRGVYREATYEGYGYRRGVRLSDKRRVHSGAKLAVILSGMMLLARAVQKQIIVDVGDLCNGPQRKEKQTRAHAYAKP